MEKPYNMRLFQFFLNDVRTKYTRNSERMKAWLELERDSNQYNPDINFYNNFFNGRGPRVDSLSQAIRTSSSITTKSGLDFTTSNSSETLSGKAPITFFDVRVQGHKEAQCLWSGTSSWIISIQLRSGVNTLKVQGVDYFAK